MLPGGKRQRRQAAATLVSNVSNWTGVGGKKSKAQPRPVVQVPPKGIGPIVEPNQNDVLCGRGGRINSHEGNVQFRDLVHSTKKNYLAKTTKKLEKAHIAARLVQQIREMNPPGRFLKEEGDGMWWDIGDAKAFKKVGQALREDAPEIRPDIDEAGEKGERKEGDDQKKASSDDTKKKAATATASNNNNDDSNNKAKATSTASPTAKRVIVLPTTRAGRRGEDDSPGALPPPPSSASIASGGSGPYQRVVPGMMYPPSSNNSAASTLRHGQFSYGRGQGGAMSRQAMEMMNQQQLQHHQQQQQQMMMQNKAIFGRMFTPPSEMSFGSHGSSVSGLSGLTNSALMNEGSMLSGMSDGVSSLTAGSGGRFPAGRMDQATYNNHMMMMNNNFQQQNMNAAAAMNMGPPPVGMYQSQGVPRGGSSDFSGSRGSNGSGGFNNYSLTAGSDLSGQKMPPAPGIFGRTASHNDLSDLMRDDMSITQQQQLERQQQQQLQERHYQQQLMQHQQQEQLRQQARHHQQHQQQQPQPQHMDGMDETVASGHSFESRIRGSHPSYKDGMDFSVFSGASLANTITSRSRHSARGGPSLASRYGSTNASVSNRSHASNYSISAMSQSIAEMSLHSGASVASFSAQSLGSDFSETLVALDLAETSSRNPMM